MAKVNPYIDIPDEFAEICSVPQCTECGATMAFRDNLCKSCWDSLRAYHKAMDDFEEEIYI